MRVELYNRIEIRLKQISADKGISALDVDECLTIIKEEMFERGIQIIDPVFKPHSIGVSHLPTLPELPALPIPGKTVIICGSRHIGKALIIDSLGAMIEQDMIMGKKAVELLINSKSYFPDLSQEVLEFEGIKDIENPLEAMTPKQGSKGKNRKYRYRGR